MIKFHYKKMSKYHGDLTVPVLMNIDDISHVTPHMNAQVGIDLQGPCTLTTMSGKLFVTKESFNELQIMITSAREERRSVNYV